MDFLNLWGTDTNLIAIYLYSGKVLSTVQPSEVMQPPLELMQHTTRRVLCKANDGK